MGLSVFQDFVEAFVLFEAEHFFLVKEDVCIMSFVADLFHFLGYHALTESSCGLHGTCHAHWSGTITHLKSRLSHRVSYIYQIVNW